jgi:hypothetical protein
MPVLTVSDALILAINDRRDAAESHRTPSGIAVDQVMVGIHTDAADEQAKSLASLCEQQ